jgi:adhesin/invasin
MRRRLSWCPIACVLLVTGLAVAPRLFAAALPEWMDYWEFGINIDEHEPPRYFVDAILPLSRQDDAGRVVFVEPRMNVANNEALYNLGAGIRQLVANKAWLVGANMFYDYETTHSHYRIGWGLEALSAYAELRANSYLALSQVRLVEERVGVSVFEEAVHGYDVEVGAPVPYYSRLKLFGGFNWHNFEKLKNPYGWTLRTEYTPVPFIVIDGLVSNDTTTNLDWGMTVAFRIPLGGNVERMVRSPAALDETMFPASDASEHLWRLVERHHDIVVERFVQTGTVSVEISRGT